VWGNIQAMRVAEIFYSMSGEGQSSGLPSTFIRFAGCNFSEEGHPCSYCDTPQAWYRNQGKEMTEEEIVTEVSKFPAKHVILTGGEPLAQDCVSLVYRLISSDYKVEIETNGSISIKKWPLNHTIWSLDIKCPSSNNDEYNRYDNLKLLRKRDQVKFICQDRENFDFALDVLLKYPTKAQVFFQSVWDKLDPKELSEWIKKDYPVGRLGLQIHKVLGVR